VMIVACGGRRRRRAHLYGFTRRAQALLMFISCDLSRAKYSVMSRVNHLRKCHRRRTHVKPDPLGVDRHSGHRHFEVELMAGGIIHPSHPNSLAELYAQIQMLCKHDWERCTIVVADLGPPTGSSVTPVN